MRIERLQRKPGIVVIEFSKEGAGGKRDQFSMKCHDDPNDTMDPAVKALVPHVLEMLELDDQWGDTLTITQISFGYKGNDEIMGCSITGVKDLQDKKRPFPFTTPYATSKQADSTVAKKGRGRPAAVPDLLTDECVKVVEAIIVEAEKYVMGKRMQLEFNLDNAAGVTQEKATQEVGLIEQAKAAILEKQRATLALVEKCCDVDAAKAAWIMEQLESEGFIGPPTGSGGPREILVETAA